MRLTCKLLDGRTAEIDNVDAQDTVASLKLKLQDELGVPAEDLRLICAGRGLEDSKQMDDYAIDGDSTIYVIMRLRAKRSEDEESPQQAQERKERDTRERVEKMNHPKDVVYGDDEKELISLRVVNRLRKD